jgi:hypothetical protein
VRRRAAGDADVVDGGTRGGAVRFADQNSASWNRLTSWLRQIDQLRLGIAQILALSNQEIVGLPRWERH